MEKLNKVAKIHKKFDIAKIFLKSYKKDEKHRLCYAWETNNEFKLVPTQKKGQTHRFAPT